MHSIRTREWSTPLEEKGELIEKLVRVLFTYSAEALRILYDELWPPGAGRPRAGARKWITPLEEDWEMMGRLVLVMTTYPIEALQVLYEELTAPEGEPVPHLRLVPLPDDAGG